MEGPEVCPGTPSSRSSFGWTSFHYGSLLAVWPKIRNIETLEWREAFDYKLQTNPKGILQGSRHTWRYGDRQLWDDEVWKSVRVELS